MREPPNETVLLHYVGSDKPWQLWNQQQISTYYRKYKNVTWCDVEDVSPRCAKELKKCYKTLNNKKQFIEAFCMFVRYHLARFLEKGKLNMLSREYIKRLNVNIIFILIVFTVGSDLL